MKVSHPENLRDGTNYEVVVGEDSPEVRLIRGTFRRMYIGPDSTLVVVFIGGSRGSYHLEWKSISSIEEIK